MAFLKTIVLFYHLLAKRKYHLLAHHVYVAYLYTENTNIKNISILSGLSWKEQVFLNVLYTQCIVLVMIGTQ